MEIEFVWKYVWKIRNWRSFLRKSLLFVFVRCRHWNLFSGGGAVLNSNLHHRQLIHSLEKSKQPSSGKNMKPKILGLREQLAKLFIPYSWNGFKDAQQLWLTCNKRIKMMNTDLNLLFVSCVTVVESLCEVHSPLQFFF